MKIFHLLSSFWMCGKLVCEKSFGQWKFRSISDSLILEKFISYELMCCEFPVWIWRGGYFWMMRSSFFMRKRVGQTIIKFIGKKLILKQTVLKILLKEDFRNNLKRRMERTNVFKPALDCWNNIWTPVLWLIFKRYIMKSKTVYWFLN